MAFSKLTRPENDLQPVVDREGRIAFAVLGPADRLAQEYGWRIDALLGH